MPAEPLTPEERIERGYTTIHELCSGRLRWEMRVPAEPDHDPDLILTDALAAGRELLDAERAAHAPTLDHLAEAVRGLDGYGALGHPGGQFIARAAVLALIEEAR